MDSSAGGTAANSLPSIFLGSKAVFDRRRNPVRFENAIIRIIAIEKKMAFRFIFRSSFDKYVRVSVEVVSHLHGLSG
jgi:hypothetical protein